MNQEPFIIERTYNATVDKVWRAITDKDEMKEWYFNLKEFKPEVGFEFQFEAGDEKESYIHLCKITEVEPGKKLAYSWRYDGHPGDSVVTFELFDEDGKTRLKLTHTGLETFRQDHPSFARSSFAAGWTQIVGTSLKEYVEK